MSVQSKKPPAKDVIVLRPDMHVPRWESVLDDAPQAPAVLIVDDVDLNRRLLKAILKTANYRISEAKQPSSALTVLEQEKIDLVVIDQVMPEMSGPEFCRLLKNDRKTQLIPVLMTTSVQGTENEIEGIESGADEFLIKPLQPSVVRSRIRAMLRNKALIDSLEEAEAILFALAQSVEHRDKYTGMHCERLASYSIALGRALGLPRQDQLALYRGGYLHDIGKISIPDAILFKRGLLTDEEWQAMRLHTIRGEEICRPMKTLAPVLPIIRSHHERWDGTGYPDRLAGEEIPLLARILQVADIYDALTTARPYKPAFTHQHAIEIMLEEAQRGWRDPELVPLFAEICQKPTPDETGSLTPWTGSVTMQQSLENMRRELSK
ncbi:MAG TPA: HD domain-containing phosphohydrolase [Bryobacteraceae bacterium]|nr:HD domain-containing phosphohydrolase [Bryobacteraceae bacterium]